MLTVLEEKLAEAHGLAIGASAVTAKLAGWVELASLRPELDGMHRDAEETRARCLRVEVSRAVAFASSRPRVVGSSTESPSGSTSSSNSAR